MNKLKWEDDPDFDVHILGTKKKVYADIAPCSTSSGYHITLLIDRFTGKPWTKKKAKAFVSKLYNVKQ